MANSQKTNETGRHRETIHKRQLHNFNRDFKIGFAPFLITPVKTPPIDGSTLSGQQWPMGPERRSLLEAGGSSSKLVASGGVPPLQLDLGHLLLAHHGVPLEGQLVMTTFCCKVCLQTLGGSALLQAEQTPSLTIKVKS